MLIRKLKLFFSHIIEAIGANNNSKIIFESNRNQTLSESESNDVLLPRFPKKFNIKLGYGKPKKRPSKNCNKNKSIKIEFNKNTEKKKSKRKQFTQFGFVFVVF